ncbi:hypothetical protein N0102_34390, partial [Pseudomonas aeruginosa]|nr:hypothetical protein [Pseudomonas aeruginosa]
ELTFSKILDSFSSRSDFFYTLKCEEPLSRRNTALLLLAVENAVVALTGRLKQPPLEAEVPTASSVKLFTETHSVTQACRTFRDHAGRSA